MRSNTSRLFIIILLFAVALLVKFSGPSIVVSLFEQNKIEVLNQICKVTDNQGLDFYLGRVDELLWGPVFVFLTGVAFLIFAVSFLANSSDRIFCLSVFIYFLATKFDIMFWPPYGDSASGPFIEGWWLYKNHFDYIGLLHQPNFVEGGPRTYVYSIYPTYVAFLLKFIPNTKLFLLVHHLFAFLFSAVTITFLRKILLKCYDSSWSLLASLVILALPLFQSQAEQLNMEMPMLMFAVISIYYLIEKKMGRACLFAALAVLVKGVGINISMAVTAIGIYLFFLHPQSKGDKKILLWTLFMFFFFIVIFYLNHTIIKEEGKASLVGYLEGWKEMRLLAAPYLFMASLAAFIGLILWRVRQNKEKFLKVVSDHYVALVMFMASATWFVVFINSSGQMVRYRLLLVPFLFFCVFYVLTKAVVSKKIIQAFLVICILIGLINSYGIFFRPHPESMHSVLERTLEYRNDLKLQMKLADELQSRFKDFLIGAQFTIAQILFIPEFGFVKDQLDVMIYEFPSTYGIKPFNGLQNLNVYKTIWVGYDAPVASLPSYPIGPKDKVVQVLRLGDKKVTLFMGGEYIQKKWLVILMHYLQKNNP